MEGFCFMTWFFMSLLPVGIILIAQGYVAGGIFYLIFLGGCSYFSHYVAATDCQNKTKHKKQKHSGNR